MKMPTISLARFASLLPMICDKDTSQDPNNWTPDNRLWGHCAAVSLVAQNLFGGELLRGSLAEVPDFAHMRSHYWNKLADGSIVDFTRAQFGNKHPTGLKGEVRTREYVLFDPLTGKPREIMDRYRLLALRLAKALANCNPLFNRHPLFDDGIYKACFRAALDSPCQKMKFGCVITNRDKNLFYYEGYNCTIPALKSLCEPKCIRLSITSRTEPMLGACGHAEERGLWEVARNGISLHECDLYVAGFYPNGLPWIKKEAEFTCLRCAVQMHNAKINRIYVPVKNGWEVMDTETALKTALAYATQKKKVL